MSGLSVNITLTDEQLDVLAVRVASLLEDEHSEFTIRRRLAERPQRGPIPRLTQSRIYNLLQLEHLEPERDGRRLLFRRSDLDAYVCGG